MSLQVMICKSCEFSESCPLPYLETLVCEYNINITILFPTEYQNKFNYILKNKQFALRTFVQNNTFRQLLAPNFTVSWRMF